MGSFLKKLGTTMLKVGVIAGQATVLKPYIDFLLPKVVKDSPTYQTIDRTVGDILRAIGTAEVVATAMNSAVTGADKLKAATPFVSAILDSSELLSGLKLKDQAKHDAAVTAITSGFADLLNSYEAA